MLMLVLVLVLVLLSPLQGQLYVFSSCMVFHAHLIAVVKVVRICFKVRSRRGTGRGREGGGGFYLGRKGALPRGGRGAHHS
jgi:hypothetical protein